MKNKDLNYCLNLPWSYTVETDCDRRGNKIYILSVNELPGVKTDSESLEQAIVEIKDAMKAAFELYRKHSQEIPEPINPNYNLKRNK